MSKKTKVIILCALFVLFILIGFLIYKKVKTNKKEYVEIKFVDEYTNEVLSTQNIEVGLDAKVPEEPKHEGCKFSGWYTKDNEKITEFSKVSSNLVVYAKCEDLYYNVKFYDTVSKKVIDTQKIKYGNDAIAPVAPEHYGYNFLKWKGNYYNVKSNVVINGVYSRESAKYTINYYTLDENNKETLYATKTYNGYVNNSVNAKLISINGYNYYKNYLYNVLSGKIKLNNNLLLKVYYSKNVYTVSVDGIELDKNEYKHNEEFTLPILEKSYTVTYRENDSVINKLSSEEIKLNLLGYCKNVENCDNPISPSTVVKVSENVTYYPVWEDTKKIVIPKGEGYKNDTDIFNFVKWIYNDNEISALENFDVNENVIFVAQYKKEEGSISNTNYIINKYYDNELYSSYSYDGIIGNTVLSSTYEEEIDGYDFERTSGDIILSENEEENVINIYYISSKNRALLLRANVSNSENSITDDNKKEEQLELEESNEEILLNNDSEILINEDVIEDKLNSQNEEIISEESNNINENNLIDEKEEKESIDIKENDTLLENIIEEKEEIMQLDSSLTIDNTEIEKPKESNDSNDVEPDDNSLNTYKYSENKNVNEDKNQEEEIQENKSEIKEVIKENNTQEKDENVIVHESNDSLEEMKEEN